MKFRPADAAVFAAAVSITVFCAIKVYGGGGRPLLRVQGASGSWVYPLDKPRRLELPGPLGLTVAEISGGAARITASPCTNKTCLASGAIRARGQWIACLPNGISLNIDGGPGSGDGLDAAAW